MKIVHVISGLNVGGAETVLRQLVENRRPGAEAEVISLSTLGPIGERLQSQGIAVHALGASSAKPDPSLIWRAARLLRQARPDVVQTWMYHADLIGGLAARLAGIPAVWGLHDADLTARYKKRSTLLVARACAILSRSLPAAVVSCSDAAVKAHAAFGYGADSVTVIPNGFDLERYRPDPAAGAAVRAELGIPAGAQVVGMVARLHPQKNHAGFFEMAARISAVSPQTRFLLAGPGVTPDCAAMAQGLSRQPRPEAFHLLGPREDTPALYNALDVLASPGWEAFPVVVGEAMACGVACVVTDTGDSAALVGETGAVVAPGDAGALAEAVMAMLALPKAERRDLGAAARRRVADRYSLATMVHRYEALHAAVAAAR